MLSFRRLALIVLACSSFGAWSDARAWWNDDWQFRKELTFDLSAAGADISGSPADVPVLVRLSLGNFQYFADAKPDGSDLRFIAADDKTPLKFHVDRFDAQSQMAFLWVRVPRLTGGAATDKIFLYYGNPEATAAGDSAGSYDANVALVYHFGAPAGSAQDATAFKTEPAAFQAEVVPASLIGSGARFNGTSSITVPATSALQLVPAQGLTMSAWLRIEAQQSNGHLLTLGDANSRVVVGVDGMTPFASLETPASAPVRIVATQPLEPNAWAHLAVRVGGGKLGLFVSGVEVATADVTVPAIAGELLIGAGAANAGQLIGDVDEVQVSNVSRPSEWLSAAAKSQGVVAPLVMYGGDAQKEGGGEGYFATTMRNVTVDGWVVIVLCLLLLVFSAYVMISKILFLNRVVKGNEAFIAEYRKYSKDPAGLERTLGKAAVDDDTNLRESGQFGLSTLFRLYHVGMRETLQRLEGESVGAARAKTIGAQSTEAIRAVLDASSTRMAQRLQSQMVWLTISISGGPFLGLLGTVVGVMITFAAIAQSGDVNVNAIAPGIAAALAATVAGLGVAIPCLFGYNYLNTRIKDIVTDMRVFIDEFITKMAEIHS